MSLLRFFRSRRSPASQSDGSLAGAPNADPSSSDPEKHDDSKQETEPTIAEVSSLDGLEITTEKDPGLNPGELTFEEGTSRERPDYCRIPNVGLDTAGGLGRHLGVFSCTLLM